MVAIGGTGVSISWGGGISRAVGRGGGIDRAVVRRLSNVGRLGSIGRLVGRLVSWLVWGWGIRSWGIGSWGIGGLGGIGSRGLVAVVTGLAVVVDVGVVTVLISGVGDGLGPAVGEEGLVLALGVISVTVLGVVVVIAGVLILDVVGVVVLRMIIVFLWGIGWLAIGRLVGRAGVGRSWWVSWGGLVGREGSIWGGGIGGLAIRSNRVGRLVAKSDGRQRGKDRVSVDHVEALQNIVT
jgi:hypothetical protein